ncbi:nucleotidyltransferase family protein [Enhydrobacter aerosaccus]|uniref:nucleotidyltransferase domain-containing protein n=1 Tax=Enhydrobacter aerosaccus TaxID=225324 RepID=UPI001481E72B|nr:nucleotidyltransferase family protein [Enhydrobacter aerosaccus]
MAEHREGEREFALLCLAVRPQPDFDGLKTILQQGVDESVLLRLAERHGVRPGLIQSLAALSWERVPRPVRQELEAFQHRHLIRTLALANELRGVAALLGTSGIAFAAFKGPTLALSLYGGVAAREYGDIDIIVREDRVADAERQLKTLGYHLPGDDPAYRHAFLGYQRQYELVRDDTESAIDLHWAFSGSHVPFPLATDEIWSGLQPVPIGGRDIPTLQGPELALLLAGHGTKERWGCLKWVCDFALLMDRHPDLDWMAVHRRAAQHDCGDAVLLGCAMARDVLEQPVPSALDAQLTASKRVRSLSRLLVERLQEGPWPAGEPENFTDFDLCERPLDRVKATLKIVFTPTGSDHAAMPLPQALWPAYYLTRPFRLASRLLTRSRP